MCMLGQEMEGGGPTPSEAQPRDASEEPYGSRHPLPPSAVWPQAPGSKWADGLQIRLASALLTPS